MGKIITFVGYMAMGYGASEAVGGGFLGVLLATFLCMCFYMSNEAEKQ